MYIKIKICIYIYIFIYFLFIYLYKLWYGFLGICLFAIVYPPIDILNWWLGFSCFQAGEDGPLNQIARPSKGRQFRTKTIDPPLRQTSLFSFLACAKKTCFTSFSLIQGNIFTGVSTPLPNIFPFSISVYEMLTRQDMNAPSNRVAMPIPAIKRRLATFFCSKLPRSLPCFYMFLH